MRRIAPLLLAVAAAAVPHDAFYALSGIWDGAAVALGGGGVEGGSSGAVHRRVRVNLNATSEASATEPGTVAAPPSSVLVGGLDLVLDKSLAPLQAWSVVFDAGSNASGTLVAVPVPGADAAALAQLGLPPAFTCRIAFLSLGPAGAVSAVMPAEAPTSDDGAGDDDVVAGSSSVARRVACTWGVTTEQRRDMEHGGFQLQVHTLGSGAGAGGMGTPAAAVVGVRRPRKAKLGSYFSRFGPMLGFGVMIVAQIFFKTYSRTRRLGAMGMMGGGGRNAAGKAIGAARAVPKPAAAAAAAAAAAGVGSTGEGAAEDAPAADAAPVESKKDA